MSNASSTQIQRIVDKISKSREQGDYTDLKIVCDGVELNVHKIILCSQSPVFRAACAGNFKASVSYGELESVESTYQMMDESIPVVKRMLDYLYTGDYSDFAGGSSTDAPANEPLSSMSSLQLHAQLFTIGDKYCIPELCDAAAEKYSSRLIKDFDPIEYLDSIPDVFCPPLNHNKGLKELVVRFSRVNLRFHLQDASIRAKYDAIAAETPDFVKELLDAYLEAPLLEDCENCGCARPMSALQVRCQKCGRGKGAYKSRYNDW
ncbi:hypothetical protein AARAC_010919 [Aspergillus arachidicola]|uniref:BTB domain-containing protein n=1 Tax=Aspergillus arachidicola TaxID=656916 RepID=A0A2G7FVH2_9EURO|nr:hypothetical protein AARAC_010919 [Aspergillus arachidicola]